jgi:hypothetical protein
LPDEPLAHLTHPDAAADECARWRLVLDTRDALPPAEIHLFPVDATYTLAARSLALFCWPRSEIPA